MKKKNPGGIIYKATNMINNKIYIGYTTTTLKNRMRQHKYGKSYFGKSIKKYGFENFKWEILEDNILKENIRDREIYYIKNYNSNNSKFGYNLTDGGDGNITGNRKKRLKINWEDPTTLNEYLDFIDFIKKNNPQLLITYSDTINHQINKLCLV